jgi:hypothetical protein
MATPTKWFLSVPMLVAGSIALSGCGGRSSSNPTIISYRPVGICKGYETPDGPVTAGANKGFAVFKIESVDNTKYASSFTFAPERLFVNQSTRVRNGEPPLCETRSEIRPDRGLYEHPGNHTRGG